MPSMRLAAVVATAHLVSAARVKVQQLKALSADLDRVNLPDHLPLCADEIVAETCQETFGQEGEGAVTSSDLQEILSATSQAADSLWAELGLAQGEAVQCSTLCRQTAEVLRRVHAAPPASDVGCYLIGEDGPARCDVDVRPSTIKKQMKSDDDLPDFHDSDKEELVAKATTKTGALLEGSGPEQEDLIDYPVKVAVRRTANLFRIYPATLTTVGQEAGDEEVADIEGEVQGASMVQLFASGGASCQSWCTASDCSSFPYSCGSCSLCSATPAPAPVISGVCKSYCSAKYCDLSGCSGCSYCGATPIATPTPSPTPSGRCSSWCTYDDCSFSSCAGCHVCSGPAPTPAPELKCKSWCVSWDQCKYSSCSGCSVCLGPAPTPAPTPPPSAETLAWKAKIQKANVKAIAYVQTALRKFKAKNTQAAITKWYGANAYTDETLRARLLAILNGVDAMLGNVEYAKGPKCSPRTYAYVYPTAYTDCTDYDLDSTACTKNKKGQFIFYICDLTINSAIREQIETMTHEGSHHKTARTNDVPFEGGKAYGRSVCQRLATVDPSKAIENADNFCYYVQDVTEGV